MAVSDYISIGSINELELLAANNNCVLWIRNMDYSKQLYVSNSYNELFEEDSLALYNNPGSWGRSLDVENTEKYNDELKNNRTHINPDYTAIYCIKLRNGQKRWFLDRSLQLPVDSIEGKIIIGCALPFIQSILGHSKDSEKLDYIITQYYQILTKTFQLKDKINKNNKALDILSLREKQTLRLFIQGYTIAQVAEKIYLSPRTVEGYLINLRSKLNCNSKSELIMKAIENEWLLLNIV